MTRLLRDRRVGLGVAVGLCVAAGFAVVQHRMNRVPVGRILPDCSGTIREIVVQYVRGMAETVEPTYRDFLSALPANVTVRVVCPDRVAFDEFAAMVGAVRCRLDPVLVGHEMTGWSRDRWIALASTPPDDEAILVAPRTDEATAAWPARLGDAGIADDLARALPGVLSRRSALVFDGGDFICDEETAFVATPIVQRNLQKSVRTVEELQRELERETGLRVVLLKNSPDHHAGMFMVPIGNRTVLVGDPSLAAGLLGERANSGGLCGTVPSDFSAATQAKFDSVAEQCASAGYRVVRVPLVPGRDSRTWLTWLNVIMDERDGRRIVYMPVFDHVPSLNEAAASIWRGQGWEVRGVDCTRVYVHFGTLHCLVNVLRRETPASAD